MAILDIGNVSDIGKLPTPEEFLARTPDDILNRANFGSGSVFDRNYVTSNNTSPARSENKEMNKTNFKEIIGLPPLAYMGDDNVSEYVEKKILQSMIVLELTPASPNYAGSDGETSLNIFTMDEEKGETNFKKIITNTGVDPLELPLKIAVLNDVSISESWSSDFGESRFEDMANFGSSLFRELRYITGQNTITGVSSSIGKGVTGPLKSLLSMSGVPGSNMLDTIQNGLLNAANTAESFVRNRSGATGKGLLQLATGSRVDFPMVWQGSNFTPSYAFTVRLYNPYPTDNNAYNQYIIRPLINILAFMTPLSDSDYTFGFPILCKVKCPGLFGLEAAYIASVDVIKGGDSNDISFRHRPGTVDLRFTIGALYNTMIAKGEFNVTEDRPTLDGYVKDLQGTTNIPDVTNQNSSITDNLVSNISLPTDLLGNLNLVNNSSIINKIDDILSSPLRVTMEALDAFADPMLNNIFLGVQSIADLDILNVNSYISDLQNLLSLRGLTSFGSLPLEDRIAAKIKNLIPIDFELENWYWNNLDLFDTVTETFSNNIIPPSITPILTSAQGITDVISSVRTQIGSF